MNRPVGIEDLESALMARAKALAEEYLVHARRTRDQILADATERLRLREDREILAAKAAAERLYRQRVQAAEIRFEEELDRFRWALVRRVMDALPARLEELAADETRYRPLLSRYLARAAKAIESEALAASLNERDLARYGGRWEAFCREAGVAKAVALARTPIACRGGVRVSSADGRIRIDDTFEGRLERMQEELQAVIMERLFAAMTHVRAMMDG